MKTIIESISNDYFFVVKIINFAIKIGFINLYFNQSMIARVISSLYYNSYYLNETFNKILLYFNIKNIR